MKLILGFLLLFGATINVSSQNSNATQTHKFINDQGQEVTVSLPSGFQVSAPASSWPIIDDNVKNEDRKKIRNDFARDGYLDAQTATEIDPVVQTEQGTRMKRTPIVNYNGQSGSGFPPDPSGAAGPNHYVQAVNTAYRIYNKTGTSVAGPFNLSSLWPGSSNLGDPIVMYDRHADRWFISQFKDNPNGMLIAVSKTNSPTGQYYTYSYNLSQFPDYPKFSIWWDGYYMTSNSTHTAVVFEREKMLSGDPTAQMISLSLPSLNHGGFRSPLPADADGNLPPNGTPCYFFNLEDNGFSGVTTDRLKVWQMTTNWTTPANSSVTVSQTINVPAFDAVFTGGFANISQPGTTQKLDVIQGVLMYRAQHKRWSNYNTIVLSHAVDLGSNRSGIRWYELRDQNNGTFAVHQSGTFAPTSPSSTASRWMSSAAMDDVGNIGMGYSYVDASQTIYPGLKYTGRLAGDPLGQMTFAEQTAVSGTASQTVTDRFGDYGHLALDPNGLTFWYTGEYIGGTGSGSPRTRIFSFNLENEAGIKNPYYEKLTLTHFIKDNLLELSAQGIYGNDNVNIDVITMFGQTALISSDVSVYNGEVSEAFDISNLAAGTYFVRVANANFQKVIKIQIQ